MSSRHPAPHRRSREDQQKAAGLSPWHLLGLGLVALIGTGILAAIDRSQEQASTSQTALRPAPAKSDIPIVRAAKAPSPPSVLPPQASVPPFILASPEAPPIAIPARDPGRENRFLFVAPAEAAEPPVSRSATPAVAPAAAVERGPPFLDGPTVTASLTPPARPSETSALAGSATRGSLKTSTTASAECLPGELRAVLADLAARFGNITLVSTHQLNTSNHSSGSIREKLHHDCKAADIRADKTRVEEIKTYLRGRREIGGVESYRNGMIHMDVSGVAAAGSQPRTERRRTAAQAAPSDALQAPVTSASSRGILLDRNP